MGNRSIKGFLFFILLVPIAGLGAFAIHYATQWGPWAFSDSAAYYSAAQNFIDGKGLVITSASGQYTPLQHYPPLYPLILSIFLRFGWSVIAVARWMDLVFIVAFILSFGSLLYLYTTSTTYALLSCAFLLVFPSILKHFSGMMSEPLFITSAYCALLFCLMFVKTKKSLLLIAAALSTLVAVMTRYAGIILIPTITIFLLLQRAKDRWKQVLLFNSIATIPVGLWFLWVFITSRSYGARVIALPKIILIRFGKFLENAGAVFESWIPYLHYRDEIIPPIYKILLFVLLLAIFLFIYILRGRKAGNKNGNLNDANAKLFMLFSLFIVFYIAFLLVSFLFTDPPPYVDERILTPLLPAIILLLFGMGYQILLSFEGKHKIRLAIFFLIIVFLTGRYYFLLSRVYLNDMHQNGHGHTAKEFHISGFIGTIEKLPEQAVLFSNNPALVLLYTNRMPVLIEAISLVPIGAGNSWLDASFNNTQSPILILGFPSLRNIYPDDFEQRKTTYTRNLQPLFEDDIGGIYSSLQ